MTINRFNTLLGYENLLSPMRAAKIAITLKKRFRYSLFDDKTEIMSEAEFIVYALQEGREPKQHKERPCNKCQSYCLGHEACTKGKSTYHLWGKEYGTLITKTGYDFALWLIAEGLTTFDAVQTRIGAEKIAKEKDEQETARAEADKKSAAEAERIAVEEYTQWLNEAVRNYGGIRNIHDGAKILIQRDIFLNILGRYDEQDKILLVLIDNIDDKRCRRDLISRLHNNNVASIKTFEHITGIKLAKTIKERNSQLAKIKKSDYAEQPNQYKPKGRYAGYVDKFYIIHNYGDGNVKFVESQGRLWRYSEWDFFIQRYGRGFYKATEGKTGLLIIEECSTLEYLKEGIENIINDLGSEFGKRINYTIKKHGISPIYEPE